MCSDTTFNAGKICVEEDKPNDVSTELSLESSCTTSETPLIEWVQEPVDQQLIIEAHFES